MTTHMAIALNTSACGAATNNTDSEALSEQEMVNCKECWKTEAYRTAGPLTFLGEKFERDCIEFQKQNGEYRRPDVPETDAEALEIIELGLPRLMSAPLVGLYRCKRARGLAVLDAYEAILLQKIEMLGGNVSAFRR